MGACVARMLCANGKERRTPNKEQSRVEGKEKTEDGVFHAGKKARCFIFDVSRYVNKDT